MDEFEKLKKLIQEAYDIILAEDQKINLQNIPMEFTEEEWTIEKEEIPEPAEPFNWSPDFFDQIDS